MGKSNVKKCPNCGEILEIDEYNEEGDEITCYDCGTILVVKQVEPLKLAVLKSAEDPDEEDLDEEDSIEDLDEEVGPGDYRDDEV